MSTGSKNARICRPGVGWFIFLRLVGGSLLLATLTVPAFPQVNDAAAPGSGEPAPHAPAAGAPPDCDFWQKSKINLPRLAGPIHNHEVEPQIEAEQATQLATGMRCLMAKLNDIVRVAKSLVPDEKTTTAQQVLWKQTSDALVAETSSLSALTHRIDVLTVAITPNTPVNPPPTGSGHGDPGKGPRGPNSPTDFHADLNELMRAMQDHEHRLTDLTAALIAAIPAPPGFSGAPHGTPAAPPGAPGSTPPPYHPLDVDAPLTKLYGNRAKANTAFAIVTRSRPGCSAPPSSVRPRNRRVD